MKLYMAVTADEYELPLCVEDSTTALAAWLGITTNAVLSACTPRRMDRTRTHCGYRIIRVETDEKGPARQRKPQSKPNPPRKGSIHYNTDSGERVSGEA